MNAENQNLKTLCEIGFSAARRGLNHNASVVFEALNSQRPENACGAIGLALIAAQKGDFPRALSLLDPERNNWTKAVEEASVVRNLLEKMIGNTAEGDA